MDRWTLLRMEGREMGGRQRVGRSRLGDGGREMEDASIDGWLGAWMDE